MEILLPYGGRLQSANIANLGGRYRCKFPSPLSESEINRRLNVSLAGIIKNTSVGSTLVVVNDAFRRTPIAPFLSFLMANRKNIKFIVATGSHGQPSQSDLTRIFGPQYSRIKNDILVHDCLDIKAMIDIGTTSRGTPVQVNKAIFEADEIIAINSVEPHFFAGFTGGRKSIIPGLASLPTIAANHRLAKHPLATSLGLDNNPLHCDLEEAIDMLQIDRLIGIQSLVDRNGEIVDLFAGNLRDAFRQACSLAEKFYTIKIPRKFKIVIACAEPPLDYNLYQLQKAQDNGALMTEDGGVLIVLGACRGGIGSEHFIKLAEKYPTPEDALTKGIDDDSFGIHKLIKTARQLRRFRIFYVTELDWTILAKVYFEPYGDLAGALAAASEIVGGAAEVGVLEDAGYTVPMIDENESGAVA